MTDIRIAIEKVNDIQNANAVGLMFAWQIGNKEY
jgi:hypothetical protein